MKNYFSSIIFAIKNHLRETYRNFKILYEIYFPFTNPIEKEQFHEYKLNDSLSIFNSFMHKILYLPTMFYFFTVFFIETSVNKFFLPSLLNSFMFTMMLIIFPKQLDMMYKKFYCIEDKEKLKRRNKYRALIVAVTSAFGMPFWYEVMINDLTEMSVLFPKNADIFWKTNLFLIFFTGAVIYIDDLFCIILSSGFSYAYIIIKNQSDKYYGSVELTKEILFMIYVQFLWIIFFSFRQKTLLDSFSLTQKIKKNEENLKNILKEMPMGILILNEKFDVKFFNMIFQNFMKKTTNNTIINEKIYFEEINQSFYDFVKIDYNIGSKKRSKNEKMFTDFEEIFQCIQSYRFVEDHLMYHAKLRSIKEKKIEIKIKSLSYDNENCYILLMEDISKKEKFNNLKKNNEFRNRILSSFSHELRTPLNGSVSPLETCISDPQCPKYLIDTYLIFVLCSLKLLENFLNDIVDFSQIISSEFKLNIEEFVLIELIKQISLLFEPTMKMKNLQLKLEYSEDISQNKIKNDEIRLKQVIINILSNAAKFTNKGKITIKIVYSFEEDYYKISVCDTGIGMAEIHLERLRGILQESTGNTEVEMNTTGNALGLTMSQQLALRLANRNIGGIKVESQLDVGTEFSFVAQNIVNSNQLLDSIATEGNSKIYEKNSEESIGENDNKSPSFDVIQNKSMEINLEKEIKNEEIIVEKRESFETDRISEESLTLPKINFFEKKKENNKLEFSQFEKEESDIVLLVDDDAFNLLSLEMIVNKLNLKTEKAFNGKEAVKMVKEKHESYRKKEKNYKFVLMDYQMPEMDGVGATKGIISYLENNAYYSIPIIACTAFSNKTEIDLCLNAGMIDFVIKPVSFDKIKAKIDLMKRKKII